jgi:hypothetical protein
MDLIDHKKITPNVIGIIETSYSIDVDLTFRGIMVVRVEDGYVLIDLWSIDLYDLLGPLVL